MEPKKTPSVLRAVATGAGVVAATGLAAAAGWTAYSALFVNHRRTLPPALQAKRYVTATPLCGRMTYYADETVPGRPLVLVHSINAAASSYDMRPIFEHFRTRRPVFAIDLPGFGFSERAERGYTSDVFVQSILDFVQGELGASEPVDVVTLSLSSEFAAVGAVEEPSAFSSLTFIAPTGFGQDVPQSSALVHHALTFPVWRQALYDLLVSRPAVRYYLQKAFEGPVDNGLAEYAYLTAHRPGAHHVPFYFLSGQLFRPDIDLYYTALTQPVLAFCDNSDYGGGSDLLPAFARQRRNWEVVCIPGSKAMPHFEQPEATLGAMEHFFAAAAASSASGA
ncbi:MAG TPA: alpha/beta hydrolase [Bryobacteraceae bacterium]|nr:alpha/beta hydrolase [Bryobacteraceae bacterium]